METAELEQTQPQAMLFVFLRKEATGKQDICDGVKQSECTQWCWFVPARVVSVLQRVRGKLWQKFCQ